MSRSDMDHVHGIVRCNACQCALPEAPECPECGEGLLLKGTDYWCPSCRGAIFPVGECIGGCPEPDWDSIREEREYDAYDREEF